MNPAAGATNGSINASASGGSGFTYSLNNGSFLTSGNFTGLGAGTYTVIAKNSNGCTGSATFTLTAQNPCSGVIITVTGTVTNPTAGASNGSVAASASGGSAPYTFSLNGGPFQSSGTFAGLSAGTFQITSRDANGCQGTGNFTLTAPNPCTGITITVTGTTTNPTSGVANGSIAATASGGTAPYTYSLNGGAFQSSGTFSGLSAGSYTIAARDANTCQGSAPFTLTAVNPCSGVNITITTSVTGNTPCVTPATGSVNASASGGTGPYQYSLNNGAFQSSGTFGNLTAGTYNVRARDVNTCIGTVNVTVTDLNPGPLFSDVRALIQANCLSCHNSQNPGGGMNFSLDCNIVNNKTRIQARAVNGTPSSMPPSGLLDPAERQKITNWINAGGRFTD
ncbi:MAG: hypothetical protein RJA57_968 [Bacteroidota bacterium]|jgi:mono/diheme cytochrome c family protein